MIIEWIIQPQTEKLVEQRKKLDSLRVDMKVEIFILKKKFGFIDIMGFIDSNFFRKKYPSGGYNPNNKEPYLKQEFKETDLKNSIKKWEQQKRKLK